MSNLTREINPMKAESPRPRNSAGGRGPSSKTIARREQLQSQPGTWFVWKEDSKTGGDTGQALRTLLGISNITGVDRSGLSYEATARMSEQSTWTIYVRYVGERREFATAE